jgi:hypothetical protein
MDIRMTVNGQHSSFDEVDIRQSGQDIGEAIGEAIDMELTHSDTRIITIQIIL